MMKVDVLKIVQVNSVHHLFNLASLFAHLTIICNYPEFVETLHMFNTLASGVRTYRTLKSA